MKHGNKTAYTVATTFTLLLAGVCTAANNGQAPRNIQNKATQGESSTTTQGTSSSTDVNSATRTRSNPNSQTAPTETQSDSVSVTVTPTDTVGRDAASSRAIRDRIRADQRLSTAAKNLNIVTQGSTVTLRGTVLTEQERQIVKQHVASVVTNPTFDERQLQIDEAARAR